MVVVVTRPNLANALGIYGTQIQFCKNADPGMGASLSFRMQLTQHWDACMICLSDMPFISTATYTQLAYSAYKKLIVGPEFNGVRGSPVVFGDRHFNSLRQLQDDSGDKSVFARYPLDLKPLKVKYPRCFEIHQNAVGPSSLRSALTQLFRQRNFKRHALFAAG